MPLLGSRGAASTTGFGALANLGYFLRNSLRFRASNSAFLSRTPGGAGNRRTWTYSVWVKRGALGGNITLLDAGRPNNPWTAFYFSDGDGVAGLNTLAFATTAGSQPGTHTNATFRDVSAWYHFVLAIDTTQATDSNRVKLWVNNVAQTFSYTNYPSQNYETYVNSTSSHSIGALSNGGASNHFDGYMAEINLIDGQALTPSSFGKTDAVTNQWIPIKYSGAYGTNGFYLKFDDSSAVGKDSSGNGNNWSTSGHSVTPGITYDLMTDVPTLTNATTANYCVLNPLSNGAGTLSNANLRLGGIGGSGLGRCNGTIAVSSGKWYFESTLTTASSYTNIGIGQGDITNQYPGQDSVSYAFTCEQSVKINNNSQPSYGVSLTTGDVLMVAFDLDNNKIFFGKNGTWMASSDPVTGANPAFTITAGTYKPIARPYDSSGVIDVNFGQRSFTYTPPSGFKALNTFNLP